MSLLNILKAISFYILYVSIGIAYILLIFEYFFETTNGYYINYKIIMSSDGCFKITSYMEGTRNSEHAFRI